MFESTINHLWLLVYPIGVVATNRALGIIGTFELKRKTLYGDLKSLYKIGKFRALYAGFIPTVMMTLIDYVRLSKTTYHAQDQGAES